MLLPSYIQFKQTEQRSFNKLIASPDTSSRVLFASILHIKSVSLVPFHHSLLVKQFNHRHARLHVRLETLHQRLRIIIDSSRSLSTIQTTFRHHLFAALQEKNELQLLLEARNNTYVHLVSNQSLPAFQILHASGEAINDDLRLALLLVELSCGEELSSYTNLLQKKINSDLSRNNQTFLDVVIDQLCILTATKEIRSEETLIPILLFTETISSTNRDPSKFLVKCLGHSSLSYCVNETMNDLPEPGPPRRNIT